MEKNIVVLGAGLVGKAIAIDLNMNSNYNVTSVDINKNALDELASEGIFCIIADLSNPDNIKEVVKDADLVIGAVPGFMGFNTVKAVIEAGKNMVDISFFPEDYYELSQLAIEKNVSVIVDCGVAPGMGNIILGHYNNMMNVTDYECLVGGLPVIREWPLEYKAVFSPIDVIEEYIRPARYIQNGKLVVKEALSDPELVYFDKVGTLESWNSDGLRSLIRTMSHIPNMIEKTLRYQGTIEYLRVLRELGFFNYDTVNINGNNIRPIDVTSKLLFPKWKLNEGEEEFTVMRIKIKGEINKDEPSFEVEINLYDKTTDGVPSMSRTTGYTCNAVANLILNNNYNEIGIYPPEVLGDHYSSVIYYLAKRGVNYTVKQY